MQEKNLRDWLDKNTDPTNLGAEIRRLQNITMAVVVLQFLACAGVVCAIILMLLGNPIKSSATMAASMLLAVVIIYPLITEQKITQLRIDTMLALMETWKMFEENHKN